MKTKYQLTASRSYIPGEWIAYESRSLNSIIKERDKLKKSYSMLTFRVIKITEEIIKI